MIPTFFGTTILVFFILQSAPSGPFEQAVLQIKMAKMHSGGEGAGQEQTSDDKGGIELSKKVLEKLRMQYGLDKSIWTRYLIWLGAVKKEVKYKEVELESPFKETLKTLGEGKYVPVNLQRWVYAYEENGEIKTLAGPEGTDFEWIGSDGCTDEYEIGIGNGGCLELKEGYSKVLIKNPIHKYVLWLHHQYQNKNYILGTDPNGDNIKILSDDPFDILEEDWRESNWILKKQIDSENFLLVQTKRQGVFNGYLGHSEIHHEDVSTLIWERLHISGFIGITSFIISYLVCIPLGITKALRHGSKFDVISSALIFIGFSIPAYAFGLIMLLIFSTTSVFDAPILPSRGWRPEDWEQLTLIGKFIGQIRHCILPMSCFMIGSFASLTVLMKNSLMENLSQDYVRTALAKGLSEKKVVVYHAVRNSLIPMATGIGGIIGLFLAGSYLIEKVFGIDGIGLLTYKAIGTRDYGIIMGFLVIGTLIRLIGNLISDLAYAVLDPRIRFK